MKKSNTNRIDKVELLAPAGDFGCFLAALKAGADAVYLSGNRFGARAFAGNFSEEELIRAIRIAHIFNKRIYLTVNTLFKNDELKDLYAYLLPLYTEGLDAVIVQDTGVASFVHKRFPKIDIHLSTQMSITSSYGADFAKEIGACRIVPARELTLSEIEDIRSHSDIEIECFVHGSMCYCYSGDCLMSSLIGGRSGNRGRCAQPCRLPYSLDGKREEYPLSLKDMNTLKDIPRLIKVGITSFKIEGRMKSAEYVFGVISTYRKYIDLYESGKSAEPSKEDTQLLQNLYIRSTVGNGYYDRFNGKEMISMDKPCYNGGNDTLLSKLKAKEDAISLKLSVKGYVYFHKYEPCVLNLEAQIGDKSFFATATGSVVDVAQKRPIAKEDLLKQLNKNGDEPFSFDLFVDMDEDGFLPVSAINELRRTAVSNLHEIIRDAFMRKEEPSFPETRNQRKDVISSYSVHVINKEQLNTLTEYIKENDLHLSKIFVRYTLLMQNEELLRLAQDFADIYIVFPRIRRKRYNAVYDSLIKKISETEFVKGILISNYDDLFLAQSLRNNYNIQVIGDYSIYTMNDIASDFLRDYCDEIMMPYELSLTEIKGLSKNRMPEIMNVYGRIPLMVTANCINKTYGLSECGSSTNGSFINLIDRKKESLPVFFDCNECGNIIYNSVPLSLHKHLYSRDLDSFEKLLRFTDETKDDMEKVLDIYLKSYLALADTIRFTNGHYNRGVE